MNVVLTGLGRVLGLQLVLRLTAGMPRAAARALLAATVVVVNGAPMLAVATGAIGYGDVWLWLALEVVTIYVWTLARALLSRDADGRSRARSFGTLFFAVHYGGFALVPFLVGLATVLPVAPLRSPWLTVLVLGGLGFVAAGWAGAGRLRERRPLGIGDFVRAYARMALAYAALFVPLVAQGVGSNDDVTRLTAGQERGLALVVLTVKLVLELLLVLAVERRDGRLFLLGRPVVVTVRRAS
ncbi:DUF6498-containing protein [Phycicoccus sp. DTK01]|uniref:DUF6498-containing protein n=1 Tax=Phycicoccus sp. DTK01 TaxID=2785745 RepID=UPI001A901315|nr:DUF6498-containing protein [Phycicoccus sp. DTK01]GIL35002.1 hypothetical protein PDTK01_10780 [Phycicoccus sp. DTK01]